MATTYNTLAEVPEPIREFYFEETVSEPTGEKISESFTYEDENGKTQTSTRLVDEYADVLYVRQETMPERKTIEQLDSLVQKNKPKLDVQAALVANDEYWSFFDVYQEYLAELNAYELAKEEFVPQENEDGSFTEFVGTEPTEPVKPTFRTAQEILESVPSYTKHLKAKGVEFKGVNVSLNETNQNGIFVVKGNCSDALTLGMDPFPVNFHAETINGVETVIVENIDEFIQFQVTFMTARQEFFS